MSIYFNPDKEKAEAVFRAVKANEGYCPCKLIKTIDTRCMCKEFREQKEGLCHCGLYFKTKEQNGN